MNREVSLEKCRMVIGGQGHSPGHSRRLPLCLLGSMLFQEDDRMSSIGGVRGGGGAGAVICFLFTVVLFAPSLDNLIVVAVVVSIVGGRDGVLLGDRMREIDRDSYVFLNSRLAGNGGGAFPSWASVCFSPFSIHPILSTVTVCNAHDPFVGSARPFHNLQGVC
jgi:hypothetical protein